jgi:hypothetical protein
MPVESNEANEKLYHWLYLPGFCLGDAFLYVSWTPGAQSDKMLGGCTLDLGSSPYRWRLFARSILTIEKKVRYNRYNFRNVFILYSKHPANEKECISGAKMRKVQLWYNPVQPGTTRYNPVQPKIEVCTVSCPPWTQIKQPRVAKFIHVCPPKRPEKTFHQPMQRSHNHSLDTSSILGHDCSHYLTFS